MDCSIKPQVPLPSPLLKAAWAETTAAAYFIAWRRREANVVNTQEGPRRSAQVLRIMMSRPATKESAVVYFFVAGWNGRFQNSGMSQPAFPRMLTVGQEFPANQKLDFEVVVQAELKRTVPKINKGAKIAVAVGSRGISNLQAIVAATIRWLKGMGAEPYIIPAMGSHGGATPEGQTSLLAEYGITEKALEVPIRATMEVERIGQSEQGVDVFCSVEALRADGLVVVNRVKPHTDFKGNLGSGIQKMMVIGLGKRVGAANFHANASRLGYEQVIRSSARVTAQKTTLLCGLAILENQRHETERIVGIAPQELESRETELYHESARLMPALPFDDIDLLIVDRIGKNISGSGMDPNIVGRSIHGYSSALSEQSRKPIIRRLFVRELTPETHGNGIGIGNADFTTARLVNSIDYEVTAINALTSLSVQSVKIPIHFKTDREVIDRALDSLALKDRASAKVMRIRDTLSLEKLQVSESFLKNSPKPSKVSVLSDSQEMKFDHEGNLLPLG